MYVPNIGTSKYIRKMLEDFKKDIDSNTPILGDFNIPLTKMDRSSKQNVNKDIAALNYTLYQIDFTDTCRTVLRHFKAGQVFLQLWQLLSLWLQVPLSSSEASLAGATVTCCCHCHCHHGSLAPSLLVSFLGATSSLLSHSLLGFTASSNSSYSSQGCPSSWNITASLTPSTQP